MANKPVDLCQKARENEGRNYGEIVMIQGKKGLLLAEYVKTRRTAQNISIPEAEEISGLDDSYWRRLEAGHYEAPAPRYLRIIAETIAAPLEDLYGLVGYDVPDRLPSFTPYLRSKYDLPPQAVEDLERYFAYLRAYYDIPDDVPVFPPKAHNDTQPHLVRRNYSKRGGRERRAA